VQAEFIELRFYRIASSVDPRFRRVGNSTLPHVAYVAHIVVARATPHRPPTGPPGRPAAPGGDGRDGRDGGCRARFGALHDIRLRLQPGFVLLVRRENDFAAVLPIETREGAPDSLQYFWYLERGPFLWVVPGKRDRGVRTVADGGTIRFDAFTLLWGKGGESGWIYFPDLPENRGVRVSVISGTSVDQVDPRETRYWVELGSTGLGGF
jgi:hypothetical protein